MIWHIKYPDYTERMQAIGRAARYWFASPDLDLILTLEN